MSTDTEALSAAFRAPRQTAVDLPSSQSSQSSENSVSLVQAEQEVATNVVSAAAGASASAPVVRADTTRLAIPIDFKESNALDLLHMAVPDHIKDRWRMIDKDCKVDKLFGTVPKANKALKGVGLKMLGPLTGVTQYNQVKSKTLKETAPNLGLWEIFSLNKIQGRTARAKSKGLMFFFLMTRYPGDVVFPVFHGMAEKRKRASPFSLAETGRLVAVIADPDNRSLVSMLFRKWTRADLDAKRGKKGQSHYWVKLAERYNDKRYQPPDNEEFDDYVKSTGTEKIYSTRFVPEHRSGDNLKTHWGVLRANYGLFYSKYERSGQNNPDPTCYTTDFATLLMHWTFHDTDMLSWTAKSMTDGAMDDAGDGEAAATTTRVAGRPKKKKSDVAPETILATATIFEAIYNVSHEHMTEDELKEHTVRRQSAAAIMNVCLLNLKKELGV